jgi:cell fate regulator YaaT (PSP1 superfamily)
MLKFNLLNDKCCRKVRKFAAVRIGIRSFPYYYDPCGLPVEKGTIVVVPFDDREEAGEVVAIETRCDHFFTRDLYPKIIRIATSPDIRRWEDHKKRERDAINYCKEKAKEHGLVMKISDVSLDTQNRKVTFHFTAAKRVDFRALVKDLAAHFKSRIELWQIGVRDEAQKIDGFGVCGRRLCCSSFITHFAPISVKMAREQDLLIAPSKISGVCGRLMCCLAYEQTMYNELGDNSPPIGAIATTKNLEAEVVDRNLIKQRYVLQDKDGKRHTVSREDIVAVKIPDDIETIQQKLKGIHGETGVEELPPDDTEDSM